MARRSTRDKYPENAYQNVVSTPHQCRDSHSILGIGHMRTVFILWSTCHSGGSEMRPISYSKASVWLTQPPQEMISCGFARKRFVNSAIVDLMAAAVTVPVLSTQPAPDGSRRRNAAVTTQLNQTSHHCESLESGGGAGTADH